MIIHCSGLLIEIDEKEKEDCKVQENPTQSESSMLDFQPKADLEEPSSWNEDSSVGLLATDTTQDIQKMTFGRKTGNGGAGRSFLTMSEGAYTVLEEGEDNHRCYSCTGND